MKHNVRKFCVHFTNCLPRYLAAAALFIFTLALPANAVAAQSARIEAKTGVSNIAAGGKAFAPSVKAKKGQQLEIAIVFSNPARAKSGKTAKNVRVKVNIPTRPGATQVISDTVGASNSNPVTSRVSIKSNRSDLVFAYSPHLAELQQGKTHRTLPDSIFTAKNGVVIGNLGASKEVFVTFYGSLEMPTKPARPSAKFTNQSMLASQSDQWSTSNTANPGDTLKYRLAFKNTGNTTETNVVITDEMPAGETLVPNTTLVFVGTSKSKPDTQNQVATQGVSINKIKPGTTASVEFEAKLADSSQLVCGTTTLHNIGSAKPQGLKLATATATTKITNSCNPSTPIVVTTNHTQPTAPTTTAVATTAVTTTHAATASQLADTGAGNLFALFLGTVFSGFIGRQLLLKRHLLRK